MTRRELALGAALLAATGAAPAHAHVVGSSYADITIGEGTVRVVLRIPARGLAEHLQRAVGEDFRVDGLVRSAGEEIGRLLDGKVQILDGDRRCPGEPPRVRPDPDPARVRVELGFACSAAAGTVGIQVYLFDEFGPDHSVLAKITRQARTREFVFTQARTDFRSPPEGGGVLVQLGSFLALGIEHIVTGYDHVLFIVGLVLIWRGVVHILTVVTAFTLAHSATLILAALGVVTLPSRLVESVIALSIAYVGIDNIFAKSVAGRWRLAFVFGLAHGFGFASVLAEMALPSEGLMLSLLSFNVGVELGQLAIILLLYPLVYYGHRQTYGGLLVQAASAAIVVMGLLWFVQRAVLGA